MTDFPNRLAPSSRASQSARSLVVVAVSFLVHSIIWAAIPPGFALAFSAALVLIERLCATLTDIVLGAMAASDPVLADHVAAANSTSFWRELKTELAGAAGAAGIAVGAAIVGVHIRPLAEPVLGWLGA